MKRISVLYICPLGQQHQAWRLAAAPADLDVTMRRSPSRDEIINLISQTDVLISERSGLIDRNIIQSGRNLKLIQRIGSLYHDIDLMAAREQGVQVAIRPIRSVIAVAEQMMMEMLTVLRRAIPLQKVARTPSQITSRRTTEDVFSFNWSQQSRVGLLHNKTVGILGFGEIGTELARRLMGWNCRILYAKRARLPEATERDLRIEYREQEQLLRDSDIVVCLLPYFTETDQWLNTERINMMKPGAILCEAGSGSVVDEQAVADAIRSGHLAGAAFDTYEWEPIKADNPLLMLANSDSNANVFLTPHIGSCNDIPTSEFPEFYTNTLRIMRGEPIEMRVA